MVKECVVRLLSSLLLSLSFLPLLFFSFSLLLVLAEPVVNVGGFITYTRKYTRSPERWLLIKGKWDGEMLWWTLNRVWLRWEWKKWAEKCLLSFLPLTFAPNLPYFSPLPPRRCRPFPFSPPPTNYNIHQRPPPFLASACMPGDWIVFRRSKNIQSERKWAQNEFKICM